METSSAETNAGKDEARIKVEGGVAHFPGRAREQVISFDDLDTPQRQEIASLANEAGFFTCAPASQAAHPDGRTYTVCLTIEGQSREVRVAEPIRDPALAKLVSAIRRLSSRQAAAGTR